MAISPAVKVWSYRARAAGWALIGVWSFWAGQQDSVTLVWLASLYANIATDLGAAQAADDREVLDELHAIRDQLQSQRRLRDPALLWVRPRRTAAELASCSLTSDRRAVRGRRQAGAP